MWRPAFGYSVERLLALAAACLVLVYPWGTAWAHSTQKKPNSKTTPTAPKTPPAGTNAGADVEPPEPYADDDEVRLGRQNAEQNDKTVRLITDQAVVERVNRIGQELAAVANKRLIQPTWGIASQKRFRYTFKVVDDKDVNAYSLPGGFIYVNKGLLDYVKSDDELAGVLAHEVIHAAHHHMMKLLREQKKLNNVLLPLMAVALLAGRAEMGAAQLLMASQLYAIAKINSYGVEAEKDADRAGLMLMTHTRYNPVGLYSFMLRLARDERLRVMPDLGIYRTHPPSSERVAAAKQLLDELKIPIRLSDVDPTQRASIQLTRGVSGAELAEISARGVLLCRVAGTDTQTAEERGRKIGDQLVRLIEARLMPFEIRVSQDKSRLLARGQPLLTAEEAAAQGKTLEELAKTLSDAVALLHQNQQLESDL
jgi:predicted Zn-dependent protease